MRRLSNPVSIRVQSFCKVVEDLTLCLVMSVMENAAIAGRNAALLLLRDFLPNTNSPEVHMTFQPTAPPKKADL